MAIKCKLSTIMGKNKMNIQNVCDATGLSRNTVAFLYKEKQKAVSFETLDKLCRLFKCQIQELIEFIDNDN